MTYYFLDTSALVKRYVVEVGMVMNRDVSVSNVSEGNALNAPNMNIDIVNN